MFLRVNDLLIKFSVRYCDVKFQKRSLIFKEVQLYIMSFIEGKINRALGAGGKDESPMHRYAGYGKTKDSF